MRTFDDAHTASAASSGALSRSSTTAALSTASRAWEPTSDAPLHARGARLRARPRTPDPLPPCGRQATWLPRIGAPSVDSASYGSARSVVLGAAFRRSSSRTAHPAPTSRPGAASALPVVRNLRLGVTLGSGSSVGSPRDALACTARLTCPRVSREPTSQTLPVHFCSWYDPRPQPLAFRAPLTAVRSPESAALRGQAAESGGIGPRAMPAGSHAG